jgi:hypothetical protein
MTSAHDGTNASRFSVPTFNHAGKPAKRTRGVAWHRPGAGDRAEEINISQKNPLFSSVILSLSNDQFRIRMERQLN